MKDNNHKGGLEGAISIVIGTAVTVFGQQIHYAPLKKFVVSAAPAITVIFYAIVMLCFSYFRKRGVDKSIKIRKGILESAYTNPIIPAKYKENIKSKYTTLVDEEIEFNKPQKEE